jgi:hypothetical protein
MSEWKTYKLVAAKMQKANELDEAIKVNLSKIGYEI